MRWLRLLLFLIASSAVQAAPSPVLLLSIEGTIGPASADYLHRGLERAQKEGAQLVVLRLDTPGGLDTSMRAMIKEILASSIPVAVYVSPGGARAASAGTFLLYASHIAAMAPATNLGAASPVAIGAAPSSPKDAKDKNAKDKGEAGPVDTPGRKQMNDAAAYIRGLAQLRGRNPDWAERAVREAVSLPAEEALKQRVIDLVAADVPALLKELEGRKVKTAEREVRLSTAQAPIVSYEPDWRTRFLGVIADPSIAYVLIIAGLYALFFELYTPGMVLPGVAGAIALLIGLYGLHMLPVNYAGLALVLIGIGFMIAEIFVPAFGSLGVGGMIAFLVGSVILIDSDAPGYGIPIGLVAGIAAASAAFLMLVFAMLLRTRGRPVVTGREQMLGAEGEVLADFADEGWARVHGENWRVRSSAPLGAGSRVKVTGMDGLVLQVVPMNAAPKGN